MCVLWPRTQCKHELEPSTNDVVCFNDRDDNIGPGSATLAGLLRARYGSYRDDAIERAAHAKTPRRHHHAALSFVNTTSTSGGVVPYVRDFVSTR